MHTIRNPKRVASPSIAGHQYGFVCIAHQCLDLTNQVHLIVEGNEDVDVVDMSQPHPMHTEIQYKRQSRSFGPRHRIVHESLARFLVAWIDQRSNGNDFRGIVWTTARFTERRRSPIGAWLSGEPFDLKALQQEVLKLLRKKGTVEDRVLDAIVPLGEFEKFISSISCTAARADVAEERTRLFERLSGLVPDLDPSISAIVLLDMIAQAASSPDVPARTLTRRIVWEALNDATLDALSTAHAREHLLGQATGGVSAKGLRAFGLVVGNPATFSRLAETAAVWLPPSDEALATAVGMSGEFACYIAIAGSASTTRQCRNAVRRQVRFAYPHIDQVPEGALATARKVAREIARRCIEFEVRGAKLESVGPFVTKLRWLRLSTGEVLTAHDLLPSQKLVAPTAV